MITFVHAKTSLYQYPDPFEALSCQKTLTFAVDKENFDFVTVTVCLKGIKTIANDTHIDITFGLSVDATIPSKNILHFFSPRLYLEVADARNTPNVLTNGVSWFNMLFDLHSTKAIRSLEAALSKNGNLDNKRNNQRALLAFAARLASPLDEAVCQWHAIHS